MRKISRFSIAMPKASPGALPGRQPAASPVKTVVSRSVSDTAATRRLQYVLEELRMQKRRIKRDHRQVRLSAAAFDYLKKSRNHMRSKALHIAARHDGTLPLGAYVRLQAPLRKFNIHVRQFLAT